MALLIDPSNPAIAETTANKMLEAARTLGLELHVLPAPKVISMQCSQKLSHTATDAAKEAASS
jgi:hypothetical protein